LEDANSEEESQVELARASRRDGANAAGILFRTLTKLARGRPTQNARVIERNDRLRGTNVIGIPTARTDRAAGRPAMTMTSRRYAHGSLLNYTRCP